MNEKHTLRISKYLSRHLRHDPARIGLRLDAQGWAHVGELLTAAGDHGLRFSREELEEVVARNDKKRFALSDDGLRIRANQGHTVPVELDLPALAPPVVLFHGTVARSLSSIRDDGLRPMARHAVHLSPDRETATRVGARRGRAVVLTVASGLMHAEGHVFRCSENGVWLVDAVPSRYLLLPPSDAPGPGEGRTPLVEIADGVDQPSSDRPASTVSS